MEHLSESSGKLEKAAKEQKKLIQFRKKKAEIDKKQVNNTKPSVTVYFDSLKQQENVCK